MKTRQQFCGDVSTLFPSHSQTSMNIYKLAITLYTEAEEAMTRQERSTITN